MPRLAARSLRLVTVALIGAVTLITLLAPDDPGPRVRAASIAPIQPVELALGANSITVVDAVAVERDEAALRRLVEVKQNRLAEEAKERRQELVERRRAEERARREAEERARREAEERARREAEAERRAAQAASAPTVASGSVWDQLAACESGGNWAASSGLYEGGLQFHPSTWDAHKPSGYPDAAYQATREQQIVVGQRVQSSQGWDAWPSCARELGLY